MQHVTDDATVVRLLLAHFGVGDVSDRRVGLGGPGRGGGGEGESAAVEDVFAALLDDQGLQGAEGASLASEGEDVGRGAFTSPVPGGQTYPLAQVRRCLRVVAGGSARP